VAFAGASPVTVTLATGVSIPRAEFTYERRTTADANGTYSVRVAHPGTYQIDVDGETREVTVEESAVRNGSTVQG
jgi:dolichyl-diphosphooligosaccharide--protein glycosyltransferase